MAARVQNALRGQADTLTYRTTTLYNARAPSGAAAGATSITLGTLPAGLTASAVGDKFGGGLYTITNAVSASGGTIAGVTFTPPLVGLISAGAVVALTRTADEECSGWIEWGDVSRPMAAPLLKQKDIIATVLVDTLTVTPEVGQRFVEGSRSFVIDNVGRDPAGAAWICKAGG
jgi:hypothetical protein